MALGVLRAVTISISSCSCATDCAWAGKCEELTQHPYSLTFGFLCEDFGVGKCPAADRTGTNEFGGSPVWNTMRLSPKAATVEESTAVMEIREAMALPLDLGLEKGAKGAPHSMTRSGPGQRLKISPR